MSQPKHKSYAVEHSEIQELIETKVEACTQRRNKAAEVLEQKTQLIKQGATESTEDAIESQDDAIEKLVQQLKERNNDLILLIQLLEAVKEKSPTAMSSSEPDKNSSRQAVDTPVKPGLPNTRGHTRTVLERTPARDSLRDPTPYGLYNRASKMVDDTIEHVANQEAGHLREGQTGERQVKRARQGDFYRPNDDEKIGHNNRGIGRVPTGPRVERQGAQPAYRHNEKRAHQDDNRPEYSESEGISYASPSRPHRPDSNCRQYSFSTRDDPYPIGPGLFFDPSGSGQKRRRWDKYSAHPLGPAYGRNGKWGRYLREF